MNLLVAISFLLAVQDPATLRASGREKAKRGELDSAEADLTRAIELSPGDPESYLDRGDVRSRLERWGPAIADFTAAIRLDPARWTGLYGRGTARLSSGDPDGALADLSQAIELAPQEAPPYESRAMARWRKNDAAGALSDFSKAIAIDPKRANAYGGRGLVRDGKGDVDGALADLDEAVKLRSSDAQVYLSRGRLLCFQKGSFGQGLEDLGTALRMAPRSPYGYLFRAFADLELDQPEAAIDDATRALDLLPDSAEAYQARGLARRSRGDRAGAIADFSRAVELGDPDGSARRYRGYAYFDQGDWPSALEDLGQSARAAPETRDYAEWRSFLCRSSLGDSALAARSLREYRAARRPRITGDWAGKIGAFLDRAIPEDELLREARTEAQKCEALFYAGSVALLAGNPGRARDCFLGCQATSKIDSLEYSSARAALGRLAPELLRPPRLPGRLKIEILHGPEACPANPGAGPCRQPEHWRAWIDEVECPERERIFSRLRAEARREPGSLPGTSVRRVLIYADPRAPYGRVAEILAACDREGMASPGRIEFRTNGPATGRRREADRAPSRGYRPGDEDLEVFLSWTGERLRARTGGGRWIEDDSELKAAVFAAGAAKERTVWILPENDVPAAEAFRMLGQFRAWGLKESAFRPPAFRDPGPRAWGAVLPEEAEAFGRRLEAAVAAGTPEAIDDALARQEMLRRIIGQARLSPAAQRLVDSLLDELAFTGRRFPRTAGPLRPLKFLRIRTVGGSPRPFFRILDRDRYDYVELELGKGADGSLLVLEVRSLEMGGPQSLFLRRACLPPPEDLERLNALKAPTVGDLADAYRDCSELNALVFERKFALALKYFDEHRDRLHLDPAAHRSRLRAARQTSPAEYLKAIEDLGREIPGDTLVFLLRIDGFFMAGEYDQALEAVDALEREVGADPFLLVYRANLELVSGHAKKAQELAETAASREPTLDRAWWALLNASAKDRDHAAAVRALDRLEKNLNIRVPDLRSSAGYEDFTQSEEFREWLGGRP